LHHTPRVARWFHRGYPLVHGELDFEPHRRRAAPGRSRCAFLPEPPPVGPSAREFGPELPAVLDQELTHLPEKYRLAVVLYDLQKSRSTNVTMPRMEAALGSKPRSHPWHPGDPCCSLPGSLLRVLCCCRSWRRNCQ
jgi:hypothetical protein